MKCPAVMARIGCLCLHAQAFGPAGLGIIRVAGVPRVELLRRRLLPLAQQFAVRQGLDACQHQTAGCSGNAGFQSNLAVSRLQVNHACSL